MPFLWWYIYTLLTVRVKYQHIWNVTGTKNWREIQTRGSEYWSSWGKSTLQKASTVGNRPLLLCLIAAQRKHDTDLTVGRQEVEGGLFGVVWGRPARSDGAGANQQKIPTNREESISSTEKAISFPQGMAGRLPDWVIWKQIFTKRSRVSRGSDEAMTTKERLHDQVGLFQPQLPWFLEPSASSQHSVTSMAEAWLSGCSGLSIFKDWV